jgi:hypothetical protein
LVIIAVSIAHSNDPLHDASFSSVTSQPQLTGNALVYEVGFVWGGSDARPPGHGWEVVTGEGQPDHDLSYTGANYSRLLDANNVTRGAADGGYSALVSFGGYSSTQLCAKIDR